MLILDRLILHNFLQYQEQEFEFVEGLTLITGRNRSGKSLVMAPLEPLITGFTRDNNFPVGSNITLEATVIRPKRDIQVDLNANVRKGMPELTLSLNGTSTEEKRKTDAQTNVLKLFGMNASLFDATVRLYAKKDTPLVGGKPSTRLEWMSELFNLTEAYQRLAKQTKLQIDALAQPNARLTFLREELERLEEVQAPEQSLSDLNDEIRQLRNKLSRLEVGKVSREGLDYLRSQLNMDAKRNTKYATRDELQQALNKAQANLAQLLKLQKDQQAWSTYVRECKDLLAGLAELGIQATPAKAANLLERVEQRVDYLQRVLYDNDDAVAAYKRYQDDLGRASRLRELLEGEKVDYKRAEEILHGLEEELAKQKLLYENVDRNRTAKGTCLHCGGEFTAKHRSKMLTDLEKVIPALRKQVNLYALAVERIQLRERLKNVVAKPRPTREIEESLAKAKQAARLLRYLVDVQPANKPKKRVTNEEVERYQQRVGMLMHDFDLLTAIGKPAFPDAEELRAQYDEAVAAQEQDKSAKQRQRIQQQLDELQEQATDLKIAESRYADYCRRRKEIEEEIALLRKQVRDLPALRILQDAFGRSGLRLFALNESLAVLNKEINELCPMLFDEKMRFHIEATARSLDVVVERNGRKGSINNLSSSEAKCWSLLFGSALLRLLPNRLRVDTIIMDEMEAHMDPQSKQRFAREFLPFVGTLVPKVVVTTPLTTKELPLVPDRTFVVKKKGQRSKLVML